MLEKQKEFIHTTKDGEKIPLSEMSDSHLLNTINMYNKQIKNCAFNDAIEDFEEVVNFKSYIKEAVNRNLIDFKTFINEYWR